MTRLQYFTHFLDDPDDDGLVGWRNGRRISPAEAHAKAARQMAIFDAQAPTNVDRWRAGYTCINGFLATPYARRDASFRPLRTDPPKPSQILTFDLEEIGL